MQTAGRMQQNDYSDAFSVEPHQGCSVPTDRLVNVGPFTEGQRYFLNYHRDAVLLRAVRT